MVSGGGRLTVIVPEVASISTVLQHLVVEGTNMVSNARERREVWKLVVELGRGRVRPEDVKRGEVTSPTPPTLPPGVASARLRGCVVHAPCRRCHSAWW